MPQRVGCLDQAILAAPAEDGGLQGSHMVGRSVGPVRAVVVRARTGAAPSRCSLRDQRLNWPQLHDS